MAHTQTHRYTVLGTPPHLQAGDSKERPVSVLFEEPGAVGDIADLRLTLTEARDLAALLLRHADASEPFRLSATASPVTDEQLERWAASAITQMCRIAGLDPQEVCERGRTRVQQTVLRAMPLFRALVEAMHHDHQRVVSVG